MSETKWTDAKWIVVADDGVDVLIGFEEDFVDGHSFCAVAAAYSHSLIGRDEAHANARLISAAPDMAEALQASTQLIDSILIASGEAMVETFAQKLAAQIGTNRAALAKARGET